MHWFTTRQKLVMICADFSFGTVSTTQVFTLCCNKLLRPLGRYSLIDSDTPATSRCCY